MSNSRKDKSPKEIPPNSLTTSHSWKEISLHGYIGRFEPLPEYLKEISHEKYCKKLTKRLLDMSFYSYETLGCQLNVLYSLIQDHWPKRTCTDMFKTYETFVHNFYYRDATKISMSKCSSFGRWNREWNREHLLFCLRKKTISSWAVLLDEYSRYFCSGISYRYDLWIFLCTMVLAHNTVCVLDLDFTSGASW